MAASQAVFQTTELLEDILLHLEWHHITVVQRVCKKWQSVIRTSSLTTEALFLRSTTENTLSRGRRRNTAFHTAPIILCMRDRSAAGNPMPSRHSNRLINPVAQRFLTLPQAERRDAAVVEVFMAITQPNSTGELNGLYAPEASWRAMQLTLPSTAQFAFYCNNEENRHFNESKRDIRFSKVDNKTGVTVGDMVYAICDHWCLCTKCPTHEAFDGQLVDRNCGGLTGWDILTRTPPETEDWETR